MDRLAIVSILLFGFADAFAVIALTSPDWIVSHEAGNVDLPGGTCRMLIIALCFPVLPNKMNN